MNVALEETILRSITQLYTEPAKKRDLSAGMRMYALQVLFAIF